MSTTNLRMQRHLREQLIDQVQKYQMLYNTSHENHRDNDMRDRAWLEISEKLGVNSETLKREWKILRDSLRQALKKEKMMKQSKCKSHKKWYFESKMAFLVPYMTKRPVYSHVVGNTSSLFKLVSDADPEEESSSRLPVERGEPFWEREEPDGMELFFASVCQSTKRLPKKIQSQVKRQVLDVLLRAEEDSGQDSKTDF